MDFSYIEQQTFGDRQIEAELLDLFLSQARRLLSRLPACGLQAQDEAAQLLKGSALAAGAIRVAAAAQTFSDAQPADRQESGAAYRELAAAVEEAGQAIIARLATLRRHP